MALGKAVDGDNARSYLETTLGAALDTIDAHDHSNNTSKGLRIPYASISAVASTSWSPTLTQSSSVAFTSVGGYFTIGKIAFIWSNLSISAAGSAGSDITVGNLPVTIKNTSSNPCYGSFNYGRSGTGNYAGSVLSASGTTIKFQVGGLNSGFLGTTPSFATANLDSLSFMVIVETT